MSFSWKNEMVKWSFKAISILTNIAAFKLRVTGNAIFVEFSQGQSIKECKMWNVDFEFFLHFVIYIDSRFDFSIHIIDGLTSFSMNEFVD